MDIALTVTVDDENPVVGDVRLTSGQITTVDKKEAIAQHLRIRLAFILGEWFLNPAEGMPYFRDILVKNPDTAQITALYRKAILTTPGISALDAFALNYDPRARTIDPAFEARTTDGDTFTSADFGPFIIGGA